MQLPGRLRRGDPTAPPRGAMGTSSSLTRTGTSSWTARMAPPPRVSLHGPSRSGVSQSSPTDPDTTDHGPKRRPHEIKVPLEPAASRARIRACKKPLKDDPPNISRGAAATLRMLGTRGLTRRTVPNSGGRGSHRRSSAWRRSSPGDPGPVTSPISRVEQYKRPNPVSPGVTKSLGCSQVAASFL